MQPTPEHYFDLINTGSRQGYQLCVIAAAIVGAWLIRKDSALWPVSAQQRWTIMAVALLGALIGCALPGYFAGGWVEQLAWGTPVAPKTVMGGLLMSFIFVAAYKIMARNTIDTSDAFARGAIAMMAIGRIGCILQHCCFGKAASWGMDFGDGITRIPVQYFEAFGLLCIFIYIHYLHVNNLLPGRRLFIVFALYGVLRFALEFWREAIADQYAGIGFYQWIAVFIFAVGITQIFKRTRQYRAGLTQQHSMP